MHVVSKVFAFIPGQQNPELEINKFRIMNN